MEAGLPFPALQGETGTKEEAWGDEIDGLATSVRTGRGRATGGAGTAARVTRSPVAVFLRQRPFPENIRITKVGLWYVLLTLVVALAATNTANNALYMVLASMLSVLVVSGVLSRLNLRRLAVAVERPAEVFANRPFSLEVEVRNRSRVLPRWLLLLHAGVQDEHGQVVAGSALPLLVPYLPRRGSSRGRLEMMIGRRGRHRIARAHLTSIFPLGFFRKGMRYPLRDELLVYPELFAPAGVDAEQETLVGDDPSRRAGWGHELHALRTFRLGDDPRGIHWKQTARTGGIVFMEREAEQGRRLCIVLDNAAGELRDEADRVRFERLVSEAATAAVDHLERGYEVELVTRGRHLPPAGGGRQRTAVLEELAVVAPVPVADRALHVERGGRVLRLAMGGVRAGAGEAA